MTDKPVKAEKEIEPQILDPDYIAFVMWEGTPDYEEEDEELKGLTTEEYAIKKGHTRQWLYEKIKKYGGIQKHRERVLEHYGTLHPLHKLKVKKALYKGAMNGNPKLIELWLKYEDKWAEKSEVEHSGTINLTAYHLSKKKALNE